VHNPRVAQTRLDQGELALHIFRVLPRKSREDSEAMRICAMTDRARGDTALRDTLPEDLGTRGNQRCVVRNGRRRRLAGVIARCCVSRAVSVEGTPASTTAIASDKQVRRRCRWLFQPYTPRSATKLDQRQFKPEAGRVLRRRLPEKQARRKESAWPKGRMARRSRSFYCPDGHPGRVSVLTTRRSRAAAFTGSRNFLVRGAMDTTHRSLASVR